MILSSLVSAAATSINCVVQSNVPTTLQAHKIPLSDYLVTTHRGRNHFQVLNAQNGGIVASQTLKSTPVAARAALRARIRGEDLTFVTYPPQ